VTFGRSLHKLPKAERRGDDHMKLALARDLSGILDWLLEGYVEFNDIRLHPKPTLEPAAQAWRPKKRPNWLSHDIGLDFA
jgi:hypothetical protein